MSVPKFKFDLTIETDEAEFDELKEALRYALMVLEMPNGDRLLLGEVLVEGVDGDERA
jgi:hypothetical protein